MSLRAPRHPALVALLVGGAAIAVVAFLVARPTDAKWANPGNLEGLSESRLVIRPAEGGHDQRWMSFEELHAKYPGSIELPGVMPEGYSLFTIDLWESGHRVNPSGENWLLARYVSDDDPWEIRFNQTPDESIEPLGEGQEVRVRDARGAFGTRTDPIRYDWLWWIRCGRFFELQSAPGQLSTADLIRIAESVGPEEC
jgi:hypothetical protein